MSIGLSATISFKLLTMAAWYWITINNGGLITSVILAMVAAIVYKKANWIFLPFFLKAWLGTTNELLSLVLVFNGQGNALNGNIYVLVEGILILWLFKNWGKLQNRFINFWSLAILLVVIWIMENLVLGSIHYFNSFYRSSYAFITVFLAVNQLNFLIVRERTNLLKHATFLICLAFVINFSYRAIIEVFYIFELKFSNSLFKKIFTILQVVNTLCNIIYIIALLWIQKRQKFILPY